MTRVPEGKGKGGRGPQRLLCASEDARTETEAEPEPRRWLLRFGRRPMEHGTVRVAAPVAIAPCDCGGGCILALLR